jgi:hypothetical protein
LNWRNPEVRQAMADVLRFWLRRGVDGFRVDASAVRIEDDLLRDDPPDPKYHPEKTPPPQRLARIFTDDRPDSMDCLEELRAVIDEVPDRVPAGEVQGKIGRIGHFYGNAHPRFHLPLNFALLDSEWTALAVQGTIDAYLNAIPDLAGLGHRRARPAPRRFPNRPSARPHLSGAPAHTVRASDDLLWVFRYHERERLLLALNLGNQPRTAKFLSGDVVGKLRLSSHLDCDGEAIDDAVDLRANEGVIVDLDPL